MTNDFKERTAVWSNLMKLDTLRKSRPALIADALINDLHAALQAKDAEIAELTMQRGADEQSILMWQGKVERRDTEIAELRGLLGEAAELLPKSIQSFERKSSALYCKIAAALAGKEQPK